MVHVGGEPLLDEDVEVGNHIITVLSTELVSLSSSPLSCIYAGTRISVLVRVTRARACHVNAPEPEPPLIPTFPLIWLEG